MPTFEMNMDRPNPVEANSGDRDVTPEVILDAIQAVVADVGEFLSDWVHRVDQRAASRCVPATADAALRERMEEFQSMKSYWEAKRKSEEHRLKEKADQLTEAWLRLEDQQCAVLQSKETHPSSSRERGAATQSASPRGLDSCAVQQPAAASQAVTGLTQQAAVAVMHHQPQVVTQHQPATPAHVPQGTFVQYPQPSQLNPDYPSASDVAQWNEHLAVEGGSEYPMRRQQLGIGVEMGGRADTVGRVDVAANHGVEVGPGQTATAMVSSSRESAVRQFQRLRREIDASRSGSGQT